MNAFSANAATAFMSAAPVSLSVLRASNLSKSALLPRKVSAPTAVTRRARRVYQPRMQDEGPEDDAPSDTYVPAAEASTPVTPHADDAKRAALSIRLLRLAAATGRGQLSSETQAAAVEDVVMSLEELNPTPAPVETDLLDGVWTLVYTTARLLSSLPAPLQVAAMPLLQLGQVRQRIALDDGALTVEVDLTAFPATTGTLTTTTRVTPVGTERLEVTVEKTTVTGGKLAGQFDLGAISFDIPVEQLYQRFSNAVPETYLDTYYLDDKLRISRSKAGKLYVYSRLE